MAGDSLFGLGTSVDGGDEGRNEDEIEKRRAPREVSIARVERTPNANVSIASTSAGRATLPAASVSMTLW